jgi:hypothetical protein
MRRAETPTKKSGRPIKSPDSKLLRNLTLVSVLADKVQRILRRCNAPQHWSDNEAKVLVDFCLFKSLLDAETFSRMFAEAPDELLKALPKILKCVRDAWQHPSLRVELELAMRHEYPANSLAPLQNFWSEEAEILASELDRAFVPGRTLKQALDELAGTVRLKAMIRARHIEDARERIRKISRKT